MPSIIIFNNETKAERQRLVIDEDPTTAAELLGSQGLAKLASRGKSVWVNASQVRALRERTGGESESAESAG